MLKAWTLIVGLCLINPALALASAQVPTRTQGLIDKPAPDFTLDTVYNGMKTLSEARAGKKAILFFWATWCPHCHTALTSLNNSVEALKHDGVSIILVDMGESRNDVKAYLEFNTFNLDSFLDPNASLQEDYALIGVPTLYFVDEQGIIRSEKHDFPGNFEKFFRSSQKD